MKTLLLLLLPAFLAGCTADGRLDAEAVRASAAAIETTARTYDEVRHPQYYRPGYMPPVVNPQTGLPVGYP